MESGLEDRNNPNMRLTMNLPIIRLNGVRPRRPEQSLNISVTEFTGATVSMESGLEDRNNLPFLRILVIRLRVSMESGLEDRNNVMSVIKFEIRPICLNGVRPRRPEQSKA